MREIEKLLSVSITWILGHFGIFVPTWKEKPLIFCPFHEETHPSFIVNKERNFCYCFGCQKSWDGIQFIREFKHVSFFRALEILAQVGGLSLSPQTLRQIYAKFQASWRKAREGQDSRFLYEFCLKLGVEFAGYFHRFPEPKPWYIYLACWDEFDILIREPVSRWIFDQTKDWFHRSVKVLNSNLRHWKKLPSFRDEAWRERVEI